MLERQPGSKIPGRVKKMGTDFAWDLLQGLSDWPTIFDRGPSWSNYEKKTRIEFARYIKSLQSTRISYRLKMY